MAISESSLVLLLLKQYFGEVVHKVGAVLQERNSTNLKTLLIKTKLPKNIVANSLELLIARDLVHFFQNESGCFEYTLMDENVLRILRHARYVHNTKLRYGVIGELMVEMIIDNGTLSTSELFKEVDDILTKSEETKVTLSEMKNVFKDLVEAHFLQINFGIDSNNKNTYVLDGVILEFKGNQSYLIDDSSKNKNRDDENIEEVYWKLNIEMFDQDLRDNAIINLAQTKLDKKAATVLQTILSISKSIPSTSKIKSALINHQAICKEIQKKDPNFNLEELNDYLYILGDDNIKIISVATEKKTYVVNFNLAFKKIFQEFAAALIRQRYGSSCGRIFHLLQLHNNLEQKQIEEMAMLNGKEANECIFTLHHDKIILTPYTLLKTQEATKNQHIFSVDLKLIARKLLQWACKCISNSLLIHDSILEQKEVLLQKKMRVETLIDACKDKGLGAPHLQEIYEMISPFEKSEISKVETNLNKLLAAVIQANETVIGIQNFLSLEEI